MDCRAMMLLAVTALAVALVLTIGIVLRARRCSGVAPGARNGAQPVRRVALMAAIAVAIAASAWFAWFLQHSRFMEIDRCLDAGGAWDDEQDACRTE